MAGGNATSQSRSSTQQQQQQAGQPQPPNQAYARAMRACAALEAAIAGRPVASRNNVLRPYSSESVPNISLPRYAAHLAARMEQGDAGIILGLVLILRVWRTHATAPSPDTIHRLLLAATVVAMKSTYDDFYVNKYMSRIGGLESPRELRELEAHFFFHLSCGTASVKQQEIRTLIDEGLVPLGRNILNAPCATAQALAAGPHNDAAGVKRKVEFLVHHAVPSLTDYDRIELSDGSPLMPTSSSPAVTPPGTGHVRRPDFVHNIETNAAGLPEFTSVAGEQPGTGRMEHSISQQSMSVFSPPHKRWPMQRGASMMDVTPPRQGLNASRSFAPLPAFRQSMSMPNERGGAGDRSVSVHQQPGERSVSQQHPAGSATSFAKVHHRCTPDSPHNEAASTTTNNAPTLIDSN